MFPALLTKIIQQVDTVRRSIETSDQARNILSASGDLGQLAPLKLTSPSTTDWRIYDHCAALTRLYAIYENFVEDIVTDLLSALPALFKYMELTHSFHDEHRYGVANVLQKLGQYKYKGLSAEEIVKDYYEATAGIADNYKILPKTVLRYEQNLRMNILEGIFSRLGISDLQGWIAGHRLIDDFIRNVRGGQNTIEAELTSFIQYRNEAAHGEVVNVLGKEALLEHCAFIEALCQAVYERVSHWVITRRLDVGAAIEVGKVTEVFKDNIVIATVRNANVEAGASLLFVDDRYFVRATILNIQVEGVDQKKVEVGHDEEELGFKTSHRVKMNSRIIDITPLSIKQPRPATIT